MLDGIEVGVFAYMYVAVCCSVLQWAIYIYMYTQWKATIFITCKPTHFYTITDYEQSAFLRNIHIYIYIFCTLQNTKIHCKIHACKRTHFYTITHYEDNVFSQKMVFFLRHQTDMYKIGWQQTQTSHSKKILTDPKKTSFFAWENNFECEGNRMRACRTPRIAAYVLSVYQYACRIGGSGMDLEVALYMPRVSTSRLRWICLERALHVTWHMYGVYVSKGL